jgi:cytochrome c oxidase subunit 2
VQNLNYTPLRTGTFDIACSEFCGPDHSLMIGKLLIEPVPAFNKWLEGEKKAAVAGAGAGTIDLAGGDVGAGKALFAQKCTACHQVAPFDQKVVGPGLLHITDDPAHPTLVDGKTPTPEHIGAILQNGFTGPMGTMPNAQANALANKDIANLVAYLASLK